jgi:hypothetical protein
MTEQKINEEEEVKVDENKSMVNKLEQQHKRFRWLDEVRGLTVLFLFIASFTWIFGVDGGHTSPPVGPTWLNHGFEYFEISGAPIITIIDLGSAIFMFLLGISAPIAFRSKKEKKGNSYALAKTFTRFSAFLWINEISELAGCDIVFGSLAIVGVVILSVGTIVSIYFGLVKYKTSYKKGYFGLIWTASATIGFMLILVNSGVKLFHIFFAHTLAHLAWGTLAAYLGVYLVKNANKRIIGMIIALGFHFVTFELNKIFTWNWDMEGFNVIGFVAVAIAATCVWDWLNLNPNNYKIGSRKVIKFALISFLSAFCIDFLQPANHYGINSALSLLAIGVSTFFVVIFFALENYFDFKIPLLQSLGRNAFLLYMLQSTYTEPFRAIWDNSLDFWGTNPTMFQRFYGLLLCIVPITLLCLVAWFLDTKKLYMKF